MKTKVIDFIELYNDILYTINDITIRYDEKPLNKQKFDYILDTVGGWTNVKYLDTK